jgi:hypothetical protein
MYTNNCRGARTLGCRVETHLDTSLPALEGVGKSADAARAMSLSFSKVKHLQ